MLTTNDIKNLSIALEALSRIPEVKELSDQIKHLLRKALQDMEAGEQPPVYSRPPSAPKAIYTPPTSTISTDDDIPF